MKLSVPFIPDKKYTNFLKNKTRNIESVYFPVLSDPVLDARTLLPSPRDPIETYQMLSDLKQVKTYALMNSRFIHPDRYNDQTFLKNICRQLELFMTETDLTGIVFVDAFFLNALGRTSQELASALSAVPGINCMIDSSSKLFSFIELIEDAGFRRPEKVILDRDLNRKPETLNNLRKTILKTYPGMKLELLANEGCIRQCPFKLSHDAHISFSNISGTGDLRALNRDIGCHAYFYSQPHRFLASPFIRPEDIDHYDTLADSIKICGRTLGTGFLMQTITAYVKKSFDGNLFELMDAAHWLRELYHLDNKKLDPGFFKQVNYCTKACKKCSMCADLFSAASKKKTIGLRQYKDFL